MPFLVYGSTYLVACTQYDVSRKKKLLIRLKTIHCETTVLLGYCAVGGGFSVAWFQPIGLMKKEHQKNKKASRNR
jgi:hypothetical protein